MSNTAIVTIYSVMAVATACLIVVMIMKDRKKKNRMFADVLVVEIALFCWQVVSILTFVLASSPLMPIVYCMNLPFVALASVSILLSVIRMYQLDEYHTRTIVAIMLVIPVMTTLFCLTNPWHGFVRVDFEVLSAAPVLKVVNKRGIWFWVHGAYSYLCTLIAIVILFVQYGKLPRTYRTSSNLLTLGLALSTIGNVLTLAGVVDAEIDFALIGATMTGFCIYFSMQNNHGLDALNRAKVEMFNELPGAIWVLDDKDYIVTRNNSAEYMQFYYNVKMSERRFDVVQERIFADAQRHEVFMEDEQAGVDYYLSVRGLNMVQNLRRRVIDNGRGRPLGTVMVSSDVTQSRRVIQRLENEAGIDALTGLMNRHSMAVEIREMDQPVNLPIGVIVADINNLKRVNDEQGHQSGDMLLRICGEILQRCAPPNAALGRMGGDEFMLLIPRYDEARVGDLMRSIEQDAKQVADQAFAVSIGLGSALKEADGQSLLDTIELANKRMQQKKDREM